MLRSMFSGVSGLRSHQTMMDVIGNNIANVNTVGYKAGSVVFQDLLSQTIRGAGVPGAGLDGAGGTNPAQVGLGVTVAGISNNFTQGASQLTGRATDLSIQGDGFFVVRDNSQQLYTRAGSLNFDALGRLTTADGSILQGWTADANGVINANAAVGDLSMPLGQSTAPQVTTTIRLGGNLPADAAVGTSIVTSLTVYDKQGTPIDAKFTFTKSAADTWDVTATMPDTEALIPPNTTMPDVTIGSATIKWDPTANPPAFSTLDNTQVPPAYVPGLTLDLTPGSPTSTVAGATPTTGSWAGTITVDFGATADPTALRQFAGQSSVAALSQDGSALGTLQSFTIGQDGVVTGVFSNGRTRAIGQIALAGFSNASGLEKTGNSLYRASVNSGLPQIGQAGSGGRGTLSGSTLEMSNVDLAQEFTNLIIAQRGFQANSRVITASDELLQDLVNLKR
ncbi:MAG TPA: flagellar hook protein FlgE [Acidimicrobiia bacterium]|nr:flagellar hook protein FlgE [Acidimicrobiia bacterium]